MKKGISEIQFGRHKRLVDDYVNMDDFLDDLLPKIKHWSEDLDEQEYYTGDFPWKEIKDEDEFEESILYFFKDQNEFLYSVNGDVESGQWRVLQSNKILLERTIQQRIESQLYDLLFMNDTFMVLEKPGDQRALGKSKYLVLGREKNISDKEDWRGAMHLLSERHKKGFTSVLIAAIIVTILIILFFSWR